MLDAEARNLSRRYARLCLPARKRHSASRRENMAVDERRTDAHQIALLASLRALDNLLDFYKVVIPKSSSIRSAIYINRMKSSGHLT